MQVSAEFLKIVLQLLCIFKQLARVTKERFTGLREAENAIVSLEKRHSQLIFQSGYRPGGGGVAYEEISCCSGIASVLRNGNKDTKLLELHIRS